MVGKLLIRLLAGIHVPKRILFFVNSDLINEYFQEINTDTQNIIINTFPVPASILIGTYIPKADAANAEKIISLTTARARLF